MTHLFEIKVITRDESWIDTFEYDPSQETVEQASAEMIAQAKATWRCDAKFVRAFEEK